MAQISECVKGIQIIWAIVDSTPSFWDLYVHNGLEVWMQCDKKKTVANHVYLYLDSHFRHRFRNQLFQCLDLSMLQ